jgi:hypothetical protein
LEVAVAEPSKPKRIFISYKRSVAPDEELATRIYEALLVGGCDVFIDQKSMTVGANWAERIESELHQADFLISLLSETSVQSEMVVGEIEKAHRLRQRPGGGGKPQLLPVRVRFSSSFAYPLNSYLDHLNWTSWNGPADTARIIAELQTAIASGTLSAASASEPETVIPKKHAMTPPAPVAQIENPGGTMDPESRYYIRRRVDDIGMASIVQNGVTLAIKGPRQVGKSSLLLRLRAAALSAGKTFVLIDFQQFSKQVLADADMFFRQFCTVVALKLKVPTSRVDDFWSLKVDSILRTSEFMEEAILTKTQSRLVLAMEELDTIFPAPFRTDFFGMLRSWHNSRAEDQVWRKLDLALVTSTEPSRFIEDLTQSPFNVAETLEPADFTAAQMEELTARHGLNKEIGELLMPLLYGHPYLSRRALYLIRTGQYDVLQVIETATAEGGPFSDHLRYHLFRLHESPELIDPLMQVLRTGSCDDERSLFRLEGAGLVRKQAGKRAVSRCDLYSRFFAEHLAERSNA